MPHFYKKKKKKKKKYRKPDLISVRYTVATSNRYFGNTPSPEGGIPTATDIPAPQRMNANEFQSASGGFVFTTASPLLYTSLAPLWKHKWNLLSILQRDIICPCFLSCLKSPHFSLEFLSRDSQQTHSWLYRICSCTHCMSGDIFNDT